jgi:5-methylcytosine-specific restriction endonuclease McrA
MTNVISRFLKGSQLTRNEIWQSFHPNQGSKPQGGNWDTGYTVEGDELIAFLNIGAIGRTGHDFENSYDADSELVTWFGKTNSHSQQPIFRKLIDGILSPHMFARWDSSNTIFTYLGLGKIISYQDNFPIQNNKKTIRLEVALSSATDTIGAQGIVSREADSPPQFAKRLTMVVNRYERDPQKRIQCLEHYGYNCQICGFSFEKTYGEIGKQFCHVHHIEPLSEIGGENKNLDPIKDLIPVCANCHEMLHRKKIALKPNELRSFIVTTPQ